MFWYPFLSIPIPFYTTNSKKTADHIHKSGLQTLEDILENLGGGVLAA